MSNRDLSPEDKLQVSRILGSMPYGPLTGMNSSRIETMDDLVTYLTRFVEVLEKIVKEHQNHQDEVARLNRLFNAGGDFLTELMRRADLK